MAKKSFKCSKCDRSFSMAAHLARHMSTHASPKKKAAAKKKRKAKRAKKAKRVKKVKVRRLGRPKGVAARLGLRHMGLDQLMDVIAAARVEAHRKLADLQASLG